MARLEATRLILAVRSLRIATDFYVNRLGFKRDFGDESDGWSWLSRDNFRVGLGKPWGMREFALQTPDGHRLTFGSEEIRR